MSDDQRDALHRVQEYRKIVLLYEALDKQIDDLIMTYGGVMEKMPPEALTRYRELARQRDDMQNDMRALEQELQIDEE
jgi:hypothetical protein